MNPFLLRFQPPKAAKGMQAPRGMQAIEYTLVGVLVIAGSVGGILMLQSNTAQNVHNSVMNIGEMASSSQVGQEPIKGLPPAGGNPTGDVPPVLGGGGEVGGNPVNGDPGNGGNLGGVRGGGGGVLPGGSWHPSNDQPSGGIEPLGGPIQLGDLGNGSLNGPSDDSPADNNDDSAGHEGCSDTNNAACDTTWQQ